MPDLHVTAGWRDTIQAVLDAPGTVVMVGPVDVGKTTRATHLANAAARAGRRTAVVDADTGQSDIGPPTTVGLGLLPHPVRRLSDVPLEAAFFIGDTSPQGVDEYLVEGTARMVSRARARGVEMIVVDTTGWVEGAAAVAAKVRKIGRIRPRHVIAIQRADEVEPILARISRTIAVHRLTPSPRARVRTYAERRAIRERRFARYFAGAPRMPVDLGTLPAARPVVYEGRSIAQTRMLEEIPPRALRHLLVGMADGEGDLVALGTVAGVRPSMHQVDIVAPLDTLDSVRALQWGVLRVAPSGHEEGRFPRDV